MNTVLPPILHHTKYLHPNSEEWVTFIHGAGGSSSIWFKQIKAFKKHFNILLIDLRGHGKSKKIVPENIKKYTFSSIGDDVINVLDHLKIQKSHFIGISLGTIIIRELSDRYPDRIKTLILGGAVMHLNLKSKILMHTGHYLRSILPYLILYRFFAFIIMPKKNHKTSRLLFIEEAKKLYQKEFLRWYTLIVEVNPLLKLFKINDSGKPTLYIMGSEDHMFLASIKKLSANHQSSQLQIIKNCGHVVNIEQPDHFNDISIKFILNNA